MFYFLWITNALAMTSTSLYQWLQQGNSTSNSISILNTYPQLSSPFSSKLLQWTQGQLAKSAASALHNYQQGKCSEGAFFKVVDGNKVMSPISEAELQFTNSLFLIESSYCLSNVELQKAYDVYMSTEFRLDVMPRVTNVYKTNGGFCVETDGIPGLILPAVQCSHSRVKQQNDVIIVHNTLKSVQKGAEFQPLYYREEVILFSKIPNGVALYRGTFTRSDDIGATSKYILSNTVESSQNDILTQYRDWLNR